VTRALLDTSLLLTLLDTQHLGHSRAKSWFAGRSDGWASCAVTQNGFVRVISQPRYPAPVTPSVAIELIASATASESHEYWQCSLSITDPTTIDRSRVLGPKQVTDIYLLALAVAHGGVFVTFDRHVSIGAVPDATVDNLVVL
jgi:toxin-antitoxin system PIN domain toxin